jgi:hypothetical protein
MFTKSTGAWRTPNIAEPHRPDPLPEIDAALTLEHSLEQPMQ